MQIRSLSSIFGLALFVGSFAGAHDSNQVSNIKNYIVLNNDSLLYYIRIASMYLEPIQLLKHGQPRRDGDYYKKDLEVFFDKVNPVYIDGLRVKPSIQTIELQDSVQAHLFKESVPLVMVDMVLRYPFNKPPRGVSVNWGIYPKSESDGWRGIDDHEKSHFKKDLLFYFEDTDKVHTVIIRPEDPQYFWRKPDLVALEKTIQNHDMYTRNQAFDSNFKIPTQIEAQKTVKTVLEKMYSAFKYSSGKKRYSELAGAVAWEEMGTVYDLMQTHLTMNEAGNLIADVDKVTVISVGKPTKLKTGDSKADTLLIPASWYNTESIVHNGHTHRREMEYAANIVLGLSAGKWLIRDIQVKNHGIVSANSFNNKTKQSLEERYTMELEYQGEKFIVDKYNPGFTYSQSIKINNIIKNKKIPSEFTTFSDFVYFFDELNVPGHGSSTGSFGIETPLGRYTFTAFQLPNKPQHRVFVYRTAIKNFSADQGPYYYFDDFLYNGKHSPVLDFQADGNMLLYKEEVPKDGKRINIVIRKKMVNAAVN